MAQRACPLASRPGRRTAPGRELPSRASGRRRPVATPGGSSCPWPPAARSRPGLDPDKVLGDRVAQVVQIAGRTVGDADPRIFTCPGRKSRWHDTRRQVEAPARSAVEQGPGPTHFRAGGGPQPGCPRAAGGRGPGGGGFEVRRTPARSGRDHRRRRLHPFDVPGRPGRRCLRSEAPARADSRLARPLR
jgi:hypothetical protein